jgi:hypothetical protein
MSDHINEQKLLMVGAGTHEQLVPLGFGDTKRLQFVISWFKVGIDAFSGLFVAVVCLA